jgi:LPXTG-motif cell wall-anchored protein
VAIQAIPTAVLETFLTRPIAATVLATQLPKTGGLPFEAIAGIGGLLGVGGWLVRRRWGR